MYLRGVESAWVVAVGGCSNGAGRIVDVVVAVGADVLVVASTCSMVVEHRDVAGLKMTRVPGQKNPNLWCGWANAARTIAPGCVGENRC